MKLDRSENVDALAHDLFDYVENHRCRLDHIVLSMSLVISACLMEIETRGGGSADAGATVVHNLIRDTVKDMGNGHRKQRNR